MVTNINGEATCSNELDMHTTRRYLQSAKNMSWVRLRWVSAFGVELVGLNLGPSVNLI